MFKSEAETWYLWLKDNYGRTPTWNELKQELLVKFAQSSIRKNALRDKLRGVPYDGPKKMGSYVSQYRYIETQIPVNEMAFYDRFSYFIAPFSGTLQRHLKREQPKTMEFVYDAAMEWANIETSTPSTSTSHTRRTTSRTAKYTSNYRRPSTRSYTKQSTTYQEEDDLDAIDISKAECYNCHEIGHLARDCKKPPQKRRQSDRTKGKRPSKKGFYHTEVSDEDESEHSDHSESASESVSDNSDLGDMQMLEALYEIQDQGGVLRRKDKQPLPVFEGKINGHPSKIIIDSGATAQFVSENFARDANLEIHNMQTRTVRVADNTKSIRSGFATLNLQAGTMPSEKIAAYTFPLQHFDLILGRPWLKKHNPHINWATDSLELTVNGRTYQWHPTASKNMSSLTTIESVPESLYTTEKLEQDDKVFIVSLDEDGQHKNRNEKRSWAKKFGKWIQRKCSSLLRPFGTPAKVDDFKIDTADHKPIRIRPRPHSPVELKGIKEFLDKYLVAGVIQPSQSPWSAPLVLVKKPTGEWRICVDYRALNNITTKDAYPLPRIDDSYLQLQGAKYFTSLDLQNGYWQFPLASDSIPKTAFSSRYGQYEWKVMPFGLTNAPATFQ